MCKANRVYTEEEKLIMKHVRESQPRICFYCKKPLTIGQVTLDHIVPHIRGGKTSEENLAITCKKCNEEKSDMNLEEYMKFLQLKFSAINSIPLEKELMKLSDMLKELEQLKVEYRAAKCEYEGLLSAIALYPVDDNSNVRLQKLQFLIWKYKSNRSKVCRLEETIKMQEDIVILMKQQRERVVRNVTEEYKWMLGKLKVDAVKDKFDEKLNKEYSNKVVFTGNITTNIIGNNNNVTINI